MAIAITLRGVNVLGCSVTPIFLAMGHYVYRFSTFSEKMKIMYRVDLNFWQNAPSNSSLRVKVCENDGNI